ncbi:MAG: deoxyribose-phosphate aldolase [Oscillochloris sp.]|nr:deoxyribose-phosphate aldolase [Oscillochloris sp.]
MDELIAQVVARLDAIPGLPSGAPLERNHVGSISDSPIAGLIDHTLLKPEATPEQIAALCKEARRYRFASVCVNPTFVPLCARLLQGSPVVVCTVIGFPLGATTSKVKVFETAQAVGNGAHEVDMVLAVGRLKAGEYGEVADDIAQVAAAAHSANAILKVIIETALLTDEEKIAACLLAVRAGADYVKTSTGFSGGGATVADISLMRRVVGPHIGVKASGGVRSLADAQAMVQAGATRIGASAGVAIVRAAEGDEPNAELGMQDY